MSVNTKMPRGAIPSPRSEFAASESYRPDPGAEIFTPSGEFPTPNYELAAAQPYKASGAAPETFLAWPIEIGFWGNDKAGNSSWAEEAFAKACADPKVFIPTDVVLLMARDCGSSNFARFMQTHGFQMDGTAYLDGPFNKVNWTNTAALNGAIANVGPVKIGVALANLTSCPHGQVTPGTSGWAIYDLPTGQPENHCASLCGYGPLAAFTWNSIGIIDQQSMLNMTYEAWIRKPVTIISNAVSVPDLVDMTLSDARQAVAGRWPGPPSAWRRRCYGAEARRWHFGPEGVHCPGVLERSIRETGAWHTASG